MNSLFLRLQTLLQNSGRRARLATCGGSAAGAVREPIDATFTHRRHEGIAGMKARAIERAELITGEAHWLSAETAPGTWDFGDVRRGGRHG